MTETNLLNDKWDLYYHLPTDTNWDIDSYKPIMKGIAEESQIVEINEMLNDGVIKNCMLFIMRSGITPRWEDSKNRNGGCFSHKIHNKHVARVWRTILLDVCKEAYCNDSKLNSHINGITISPKKNFCIVKVWFDCIDYQNPSIFKTVEDISLEGCLFKAHTPEN